MRVPKSFVRLFACLICLLGLHSRGFWSDPVWGGTTALDADKGVLLEGKRWFPLGIYEIPETATDFARIRNAGFNLVRAKPEEVYLDKVQESGLQAWIPLGNLAVVKNEQGAENLAEKIGPIKNHPALAIWELPDEALWNIRQNRLAASDHERSEIRRLVNERIRSGSGDVEKLKDLYREMVRAHALQDYNRLESAIAALWTELGFPDKKLATTLSRIYEEEPILFRNLLYGYRVLKSKDPHHLVWQNHAPRNSKNLLAKHVAYCDLIGCDIYPAPESPPMGHSDLGTRFLSVVGDYTRRFRHLAPDCGTLMVLQGFGWKHITDIAEEFRDTPMGRDPTYLESRFMAYDAIVNGAKGLAYWGTAYAPEGKAWKALAPVIREIAALQAFLAAPEQHPGICIEQQPSWFSNDRQVLWSARKVGEDWLILLVNEENNAQRVHVTFPPQFLGRRLYLLYENLAVDPIEGGVVELDFVGYGVKLLSTRRDLEVPELRNLDREIPDPF